ncbi:MAG: AAA family ATPase [Gammaproteobacteria bacterium]|nr:AAA family ATPase [Gammaproteobacteria bacterium]
MALLDGIVGHGPIGTLLEREAVRPAQAYLFVGPSNVGKGTVARRFAATILCPKHGVHDEVCTTCRRVLNGNHPDVTMVQPEGQAALSVVQARAAITKAMLAPVEGDRKVIVLDEAGSMTDQAANAMLKTLEEPTPSTVFILVAESEQDMPATVASRCRTIQFGRLREEDLVDALVTQGVDPDQAREVARIAGGRPGLALDLAQRPEVAAFRHVWLGVPLQVTSHPGVAFRLAEEVMSAADPLLEAIRERQAAAMEVDLTAAGRKALKDRHERALRQASRSLLVAGLEILASWYADAASAQYAGPVRNRDVPMATLALVRPRDAVANAERVLEAVPDLRANLRPQLVLATLFTELAPVT